MKGSIPIQLLNFFASSQPMLLFTVKGLLDKKFKGKDRKLVSLDSAVSLLGLFYHLFFIIRITIYDIITI